MPEIDYTVDIVLGGHSWTIEDGDVPDLTVGPVPLAGLSIRWQMPDDAPLHPAQPEPMVAALQIAAASSLDLADLDIGTLGRIEVWVGPVPANRLTGQVARFVGRIAAMEWDPHTFANGIDGVIYTIELVDLLADLAEAQVNVSGAAWSYESIDDRLSRIASETEASNPTLLPFADFLPVYSPFAHLAGGYVASKPTDTVKAIEELDKNLKLCHWTDEINDVDPLLSSRWVVVPASQWEWDYDAGTTLISPTAESMVYTYGDEQLNSSHPHIPGELPGRLVTDGGSGVLTWAPTAASVVPVLDAGLIDRAGTWVRDRQSAVNTIVVKRADGGGRKQTRAKPGQHRSTVVLETELDDTLGPPRDVQDLLANTYLDSTSNDTAWRAEEFTYHAEHDPAPLQPTWADATVVDDLGDHYGGLRCYAWFPRILHPLDHPGLNSVRHASGYGTHPVVVHGLPPSQHPGGRTTLIGIPTSAELLINFHQAEGDSHLDLTFTLRDFIPDDYRAGPGPIAYSDVAGRVDVADLTYDQLSPTIAYLELALVRGT